MPYRIVYILAIASVTTCIAMFLSIRKRKYWAIATNAISIGMLAFAYAWTA